MISASNSTLSLNYLKFLRPKFMRLKMLKKYPPMNWALWIFFNFYFTTCFNPKQGPLQVSLHFELILNILNLWKILRICLRSFVDPRPGVNFTNILQAAFTLVDPKSVKNTVQSSVSFYAFGIYERKSCT